MSAHPAQIMASIAALTPREIVDAYIECLTPGEDGVVSEPLASVYRNALNDVPGVEAVIQKLNEASRYEQERQRLIARANENRIERDRLLAEIDALLAG